jgi:hypothetical protein
MIMTTKLLFQNFLKFWDLFSSCKWAVKIKKFEKKIHGRVKILGWSKKQYGTFLGSKLLANSKNVHFLYVWRSNLTKKGTNLWYFQIFNFFFKWCLAVESNHQTYKICTFLQSASNLLPEKVPYCFLDQPQILTLPWFCFSNFSIFTAHLREEDLKILKSSEIKVLLL